ncbi:MAG: 3-deoxy-manno-octulosonate cytidylyltransferase [Bacteroidetes bacterium HGW-Bacteroidetes-21]|nr:MAG: 3-deoxy-manno-octulosonate cytidylyltransferase [Bacteroidetes bacterium HGW-Bacteroidetes-21]
MRVIIIIPARYASTRFPSKPLVEINGKTMIMHVVERAKVLCPDVYVATDDQRIYDHVTSFGERAVMTSSDHQSGTDRCAEVLQKLGKDWDVVVNLQGDEPYINPAQIEELTALFSSPEVNIATLARKITDEKSIADPNKVKVVFDGNKKALYFSRAAIPYAREKEGAEYFQHVGIYAFRPEVLMEITQLSQSNMELTEKLEQLRWLSNGYSVHVALTEYPNYSVDTPEDIAFLP